MIFLTTIFKILECFYILLSYLLNIFTLKTNKHKSKQTKQHKHNIIFLEVWYIYIPEYGFGGGHANFDVD